jgi:GNAT superfamily N-acetyltransferase
MNIKVITKKEDKLGCFPLLKQLVENLEKKTFLDKLKEKNRHGYKLLALETGGNFLAAAGIRFYVSFRFGRYLEIDDFVVDEKNRRKGYGRVLFGFLIDYAKKNDCHSIQLNSKISLVKAHKFYKKMGMKISCHRFYYKI